MFTIGCSNIYQGSSGTIASPMYPQEYPDNLNCAWVIKVANDSRVKVTFDDFLLEEDAACFDKIVAFDGYDNDPMISEFCGKDGQDVSLTSSGSVLVLKLITDPSIGARGVSLKWNSVERIALQQAPGIFYFSLMPLKFMKHTLPFQLHCDKYNCHKS